MKNFILYICIFQIVLFFLGIRFGWAVLQYDEIRIFLLLIGGLCFFYLFFTKKIALAKYNLLLLSFLLIGILFDILDNSFSVFQFQDLVSLLCLFSIFFVLLDIKYNNYNIFFLLILVSIIPCLFIFLSIFNFLKNGLWLDWQLNGGSIRIYDSTIIPIFYFSIYLKSINYKYIDKIYFVVIFLIGLALFFDGARSAILSCIIPLLIYLLFNNKYRCLISKTIFYMFISCFLYFTINRLFNYFYNANNNLSVARFSSSNRNEIWGYMFNLWLDSPIRGVGGGFLAETQYLHAYHMHNFYFRVVFEWGLGGVLLLVVLFIGFFRLMISKDINCILKAGVLGVAVDAYFSGNLIYPSSQLMIVIYLSFVFGFLVLKDDYSVFHILFTRLIFILFGALFYYLVFNYFIEDLLCFGCGSFAGREAPNFWYYGSAEKLINGEDIP